MASAVLVLTNKPEMSYTSDPVKGDGYYGFADGLHTCSVHVQNFTGRIWMEATLVDEPTDADWFPLQLTSSTMYAEYNEETKTEGFSFTGNFVYLRARVDRSYISGQTYSIAEYGVLDKVVCLI